MALGLPKNWKLGKKVLISSSALTCAAIAAITVSISNNGVEQNIDDQLIEEEYPVVNLNDTLVDAEISDTDSNDRVLEMKIEGQGEEDIENISVLKPYPIEIQTASEDLADLRNPFAPPTALGSAQGIPAPFITIKGFASNKDDERAFLNINNSEDLEYAIGQEVGNGYRIVEIDPKIRTVSVSDGISRFSYMLREF